MVRIASFDIFDTVLTRSVGSPEASFLLLGYKLKSFDLLTCSPESFARARALAEARAFRHAGGLDSSVSLSDIYAEVGFALRVSESCWRRWLGYELQMESEILQVVPEAQHRIERYRSQGLEIIFISDMYLDSHFLRGELTRRHLCQPGDRIYVSCEYQKSKHEQTLYQVVLREEKAAPSDLIHCGNHPWADVEVPKKLGIRVSAFPQGNLNRYEKILESGLWETEGLSSMMAGASRLTRLSVITQTEREAVLRDIAAGVASPLLAHFTLWILNRAKALGLKRLYFLARDGQIILAIAQKLIKKIDLDCELHYLYGSRQAWLLPSVTTLDEEHLSYIFLEDWLDVDFLSPRVILARFCLTPEAVRESLLGIHLTEAAWDRNLTPAERKQLRQHILQDPHLKSAILAQAEQKRQVMVQYLKQQGVTQGDFGLVDLGTGATLHYALSSVLETIGVAPPKSFYLSLRQSVPESRFGLPEPYLNDGRFNLGFFKFPGIVTLLEAVCSADHGSVISYRQVGRKIEPVLKEERNQAVLDWGYTGVREAILDFAENLFVNEKYLDFGSDMRSTLELLQSEFWYRITPAEAKVWGRFPMEDGWGNQSFSTLLARPYSLKDTLYPLRIGYNHVARHWWHEAAFQMSDRPIQILYSLNRKLGKQIRPFLQFLRSVRHTYASRSRN
jgi:FMN phosphatase YigB (HAD superfamily)